MRRILLLSAPALMLLAACGSSAEPSATTRPVTPTMATPSVSSDMNTPMPAPEMPVPSVTPSPPVATDAPVPTAPPVTLPVGVSIPPGSIDSTVVVDLSADCSQAVQSMRDLMDRLGSGLAIETEADNVALNEALAEARNGCVGDYERFYNEEVRGWMNAAVPGS